MASPACPAPTTTTSYRDLGPAAPLCSAEASLIRPVGFPLGTRRNPAAGPTGQAPPSSLAAETSFASQAESTGPSGDTPDDPRSARFRRRSTESALACVGR